LCAGLCSLVSLAGLPPQEMAVKKFVEWQKNEKKKKKKKKKIEI